MPDIIQTNQKILGGIPVIKGTRIPAARVIALVAMNYNLQDIKKEFPQLTKLTNKELAEIFSYFQSKVDSI